MLPRIIIRQKFALVSCVQVWAKNEFCVSTSFLINSPQYDTVQFHAESWPNFLQFMIFASINFPKRMLSKQDPVIPINKGDNTLAVILWYRKQVLEDILGSLAQF